MSYRIIVVDDDPSILDLLRVLLESEGYAVQTFQAAAPALEAAVEEPPDAAIVDLMMPEMNGLDLLKALQQNQSTRHVPALICSAYYEDLLRSDSELRRASVYRLRKPFHVDELLNIVRDMVRRTRHRKAVPQMGGPGQVSAFAAYMS